MVKGAKGWLKKEKKEEEKVEVSTDEVLTASNDTTGDESELNYRKTQITE